MSPRAGGEADKVGNRYEGAWTIRHVLYCLRGLGESITVEDIGDLATGAEFTYRRAGVVEVHQLKRQNGAANNWSVKSLQGQGIWQNARLHVGQGREFHFISILPSAVLQDLCSRARRSEDLTIFIDEWLTSDDLRKAFAELSSPSVLGSQETAWQVARGVWIEWHDEQDVVRVNEMLAELLLDGAAGHLAAVGLGDLVMKKLGVELTAEMIVKELPKYGLSLVAPERGATLTEQIRERTASWIDSTGRELLKPVIERDEVAELGAFVSAPEKICFVAGAAGGGKSAVLNQAVQGWLDADIPVLSFRLDRVEPFSSSRDLGEKLGLQTSPVAALASMAGDAPAMLVIDQLDAVSLASGRMPTNFDTVADLVREASAFPLMKVVLACRKFDIDNDHRIRQLATDPITKTVTVGPLTDSQVDVAVAAMGLDSNKIIPRQRELLRSPLNLVLLSTVASQDDALDFLTLTQLFDAFWDRKRRDVLLRRPQAQFLRIISVVANAISQRQRLSVPQTVLDPDEFSEDADVLVSEHVLVREGHEVAFFHEAFFDYAFARQWIGTSESLVTFLTRQEQELFRRAQVRQIMHYLRELDPDRFVSEVGSLLASDQIRFHIKDLVLAVLGGVADPTNQELGMVLEAVAEHPSFEARLWQQLRKPSWFSRFDADGIIEDWLESGDVEQQSSALELMAGAARELPNRLAELLATHSASPESPTWLRWVIRFASLHTSRPLFDLFLASVRAGHYAAAEGELWLAAHDLTDHEPTWAVELLVAFLVERPDPLSLDSNRRLAALTGRDYSAAQLVEKAAAATPQLFCEALLPYMRQVIEATSIEDSGPGLPKDTHFSHHRGQGPSDHELDEALSDGMTHAVRSLAKADPEGFRPTLQLLAEDSYDTSQWLLYQGLLAGGAPYAEWTAELLLEGTSRMFCDFESNSVWIARLLLQSIHSAVDGETHLRLEDAVRDLHFSWEGRRRHGWYAFNLLSALDESRLSELGRRRLGEYRRLFQMEQPPEPASISMWTVSSPISEAAAAHMRDKNWLQAMRKHNSEDIDHGPKGGARELSNLLRQQTAQDPLRFAYLTAEMTSNLSPVYGDAILTGIGGAPAVNLHQDAVFAAIRRLASFEHTENDRWIGWALRPYQREVPLDLVELIAERAMNSPDPDSNRSHGTSSASGRGRANDLHLSGINSGRGSLAEALGDLLVHDADGSRTSVASPVLGPLAEDPVLAVRECVAHILAAALQYARTEAVAAFWQLIEIDDILLAAGRVQSLMVYIGSEQPEALRPVVQRMLASAEPEVRQAGGQLAAHAALEWGLDDLLEAALNSENGPARAGAARLCAHSLPGTSNVPLAGTTLKSLFHDTDAEVRKEAAQVCPALRGRRLRPFTEILKSLIDSPAYRDATPQLLLTLEYALDQVDDLALLCAQRFIKVFNAEAGDLRTAAAGDAKHVSDLVIRGLAQSTTANTRTALLDVLDELLLIGAYGIDEALEQSGR